MDDLEDDPGVLQWLISCDDSGMDGGSHHGFGSLWMKWQRRGNFAARVAELRRLHHWSHECKWNKVDKRSLPFCRALVDEFFVRPWLSFQCIVIRKADVDVRFHGGDTDLGMRKHMTLLLTNKISTCRRRHPDRECIFRVWCDPIHSRYPKAHEAMEVISNRVLEKELAPGMRRELHLRAVDSVKVHDSKQTVQIQMADLLLGAVLDGWRKNATNPAKIELRRYIAEHLGWADLDADTRPHERKFNVWYYKPNARPRAIKTRDVSLRHPLPDRRVRG